MNSLAGNEGGKDAEQDAAARVKGRQADGESDGRRGMGGGEALIDRRSRQRREPLDEGIQNPRFKIEVPRPGPRNEQLDAVGRHSTPVRTQ